MEQRRPMVGLGVMVMHNNKILLGKRRNAHGDSTWSFPGGHLEFGESFQECAAREVLEETGIRIKNCRVAQVTNDIFIAENKHYVTVFMLCEYESGTVSNLEPHKCEGWQWFLPEEMGELPLFLPIENLLKDVGTAFRLIL